MLKEIFRNDIGLGLEIQPFHALIKLMCLIYIETILQCICIHKLIFLIESSTLVYKIK